jgi:hypothetical protein
MITKHTTDLQKFLNVAFLSAGAGLVANEAEGENALNIDRPQNGGFFTVYEVWEDETQPKSFDLYEIVLVPQTRDTPEDFDSVIIEPCLGSEIAVARRILLQEAENKIDNVLEHASISLFGDDAVSF